ncbi:hypothetical protein RvY_16363 [Ramazzottius varieornatus]|uniref:Uncharacterized protein n=1 Tax=Ramazzottius varieornatus TaxID=947166 RepID=A0A1D1W4L0_RAMVA|nr:hypothetical protein RvY_16363 [Ramazzottius varieornatus]
MVAKPNRDWLRISGHAKTYLHEFICVESSLRGMQGVANGDYQDWLTTVGTIQDELDDLPKKTVVEWWNQIRSYWLSSDSSSTKILKTEDF